MYNKLLQDKYCFPYYTENSNKLKDNLNDLPMFFVTNDKGVNYLIESHELKYYHQEDGSWHLIRNHENSFEYMFSDGYEPEDNNLCREWLFLCRLLENIYNEGYKNGTKLQEAFKADRELH